MTICKNIICDNCSNKCKLIQIKIDHNWYEISHIHLEQIFNDIDCGNDANLSRTIKLDFCSDKCLIEYYEKDRVY